MVPVLELRAAIVYGLSQNIPLYLLYPVCVLANLLPVPFVIAFVRNIVLWMQKRKGIVKKIADWLIMRSEKKTEMLRKYELFGLFLLVAIPLPGTGAWTGALVAGFAHTRIKKALPPIAAGVAVAGAIVTLAYKGVIHIANM